MLPILRPRLISSAERRSPPDLGGPVFFHPRSSTGTDLEDDQDCPLTPPHAQDVSAWLSFSTDACQSLSLMKSNRRPQTSMRSPDFRPTGCRTYVPFTRVPLREAVSCSSLRPKAWIRTTQCRREMDFSCS